MSTSKFDPNNALSFEDGLHRIRRAIDTAKLSTSKVVTSRHPAAVHAQKLLETNDVPGSGFRKWQLPIYLNNPSQLFLTVAEPDVEVPEHSHDEGDGVRFIVGGSIVHDDHELVAGDWMFIPAGAKYSFRVGPRGAVMCSCYCCCCIAAADLHDVVNPPDPVVGP